MDCELFKKSIARYHERELSMDERAEYEKHRSFCDRCRSYDRQYVAVERLLNSMPIIEPSADFDRKVLASLDLSVYSRGTVERLFGRLASSWNTLPLVARFFSFAAAAAAIFLAIYRPLFSMSLRAVIIGTLRTKEAAIFLRDLAERVSSYLAAWDVIRSAEVAGETLPRVLHRIVAEMNPAQVGIFLLVFFLAAAILAAAFGVFRRKGEENVCVI